MNASPKLQRAGRAFLLRLVCENGPERAARVLRDLADELEMLGADQRAENHMDDSASASDSMTHL